MSVTFLTAQTELRAALGNPATTGSASAANLKTCLNDALLELYDKFRHLRAESAQTITTVASTATYALGATVQAVLFVWDTTNGVRLRKMPEDDLPRTVPVATGKPRHYYRSGTNLTLYPVPDAVYSIAAICKVTPTALSADADVMPLPDSWKRGWIKLAAYHFWDTFGADAAKARECYASYQVIINDKPTTAEDESVDPVIGVDLGYATRGMRDRWTWDQQD